MVKLELTEEEAGIFFDWLRYYCPTFHWLNRKLKEKLLDLGIRKEYR